MSNRYEIVVTVRPLSWREQEEMAEVLGFIPGEFVAFARIGNTVEWAADEGATNAAAEAAGKAIRARVGQGDLIVDEDDEIDGGWHEQGADRGVLLPWPQIVASNERGHLLCPCGGEVSD